MEMIIAGTMLAASLIILLLSVLVMLLARKNLVEYTAKLTRSLDAMISGTGEIAFEEEKETLVGRIQVKMRQLYEIMKSQNEKGARDKRQIEEIVGSISHQVRTPVASLRMYHEFLEREGLPEERRREFVRAEERQLDKLEFLMKSMIKMSRLETGLIAVRVSPVEALRYQEGDDMKRTVKKGRNSKHRIFRMAWDNIMRSRGRTVLVVLSISLSLILLNSVLNATGCFDQETYVRRKAVTDFTVHSSNYDNANVADATKTLNPGLIQQIEELEGAVDIGKSYIHILPEDEVTEADGGALSSVSITERNGARVNIVTDGSEEEKAEAVEEFDWRRMLYGWDENMMRNMTLIEGNLDYEKLDSGNYVIMAGFLSDDGEYLEEAQEMASQMSGSVITKQSAEQEFDEMQGTYRMAGVVLAGIFAVIGILNLTNVILTGAIARQNEFAVMRSIGMSRRQLRRLFLYEGILYAVISGAAGVLLSAVLSLTAVKAVVSGWWFAKYALTILPASLAALVCIPAAAVIDRVWNKGSIVEKLRRIE